MKKVIVAVIGLSLFSSCVTCDYEPNNWVDLGLSVKWADVNYDASTIEERGSLEPFMDACSSGGTPSHVQFEELIKNTKHEWTSVNGVEGYKFTSSNGNSIFLPTTGHRGFWGEVVHSSTLGFAEMRSDEGEGFYASKHTDEDLKDYEVFGGSSLWYGLYFNKDTIYVKNLSSLDVAHEHLSLRIVQTADAE